jgi:hypothetical protein
MLADRLSKSLKRFLAAQEHFRRGAPRSGANVTQ